ncbi:MAG: OmpA family protein [Myxococcales bacterium]|nr:OmpA family protein [Myxococcales bacterium]
MFEGGETAQMPLAFDVSLFAALDVRVDATPEGVAEGRLSVEATDGVKLTRFDLRLYSRSDEPFFETSGPVEDRRVEWQKASQLVLRAVLVVHDELKRFREVTLYPWRVNIPHEEVHFDTGSATISSAEEPKLTRTFDELRGTLADYGRWAPVKLFVVGHTDTVGSERSNYELSKARATAIATWFAKRGVDVPIYATGLGETNLATQTPDETDEAQNRRAEYVVAVEIPVLPSGAPRWTTIR